MPPQRPAGAVRVGPEGIVRAIVAVSGAMDEVNDVIVPGSMSAALQLRHPKVVRHHDWQQMAGKVLRTEELMPGDRRLPKLTPQGKPWPKEAGALVATMQYNLRVAAGRDAYEWIRFYAESNEAAFSLGYKVLPAKTASRNGIRYIGGIDIYEFSDVLHGAHPMTMALEVKNADPRGLQYKVAPQIAWGAEVMSPAAFAVLEAKSLPLETKAAAQAVLEAKVAVGSGGQRAKPRGTMPGTFGKPQARPAAAAPKARPTAATAGKKTTPSGRVSRAQDPSFNEELHPRAEAGNPNGGQFIAKGSGYQATGKSDEAQDVRMAQAGLIKNGLLGTEDGRGGVGADGLYGAKTESAVKAWQKSKGYQETGTLDEDQYDELTERGRGRGRARGTNRRGAGGAPGRQRRSSAPDQYGRVDAPIKDRYGRPKYDGAGATAQENPAYGTPVGQVSKRRAPGARPGPQQPAGKTPPGTPRAGANGRPGATPGNPQGPVRPQPDNDPSGSPARPAAGAPKAPARLKPNDPEFGRRTASGREISDGEWTAELAKRKQAYAAEKDPAKRLTRKRAIESAEAVISKRASAKKNRGAKRNPRERAAMERKSAWDTVLEAKTLHDRPEMESKGMHQEMAGSYEALRDALSAAAREKLTKGKDSWVSVEATYPDHVIASCHCDDGPAKSYRIPYTQTPAGVKLGDPVEVELSVVAVPTGNEKVAPATVDEIDAVRFVAPAGAMLDDATNLLMLGGMEGKAIDGLMDPLVRLLDAMAVKGLDVAKAILGDEDLPGEGGEGLEYDGSEDDDADDEGDAPFKGAAPKFGQTEEKVLLDPADIAAELADLAA